MDAMTQEARLAALLAEPLDDARTRESTTFDRLAEPFGARLVLFGAGNLGRKALAGLRALGTEPLAFTDNNPALHGRTVEGLPVLPPQEAAHRFGASATFVVTIWLGEGHDHMAERIRQLTDLGCVRVVPFNSLFWKHAPAFLPHYALDLPHRVLLQREAVAEAFALFQDPASRAEFLAQLRWRLLADFDTLADPVAHEIYFPPDLLSLRPDEAFVDCGAFDGDTAAAFLRQSGGAFATYDAFEPDPGNFERLHAWREAQSPDVRDRIRLHPTATGARAGRIRFDALGTGSSHVGSGSLEVPCRTLDEVLADQRPTYLKMDIEGAELETLAGASGILREARPALAVCVYHLQDHLWRVPLLINATSGAYRFFLRPHLMEVWDLVCYAIPVERALS
jgi:FkbM family methyltransferase